MGPWVDPLLLRKILGYQVTLGMHRDQDAIPLLLAEYAGVIEDRTEFLTGASVRNPAVEVARIGRMLAAQGACVLGIPCNTFHAAPIFARFEQELADLTSVQVVHMIQATLRDLAPGLRRIGILSTNGTYVHRIYSAPVEASGLEAVTLPYDVPGAPAPVQNDVHQAICHPEWGVKSGSEWQTGYPRARAVLKAAARRLQERGAEVVILGCTEIPLGLEQRDVPNLPLHDPLDSLARALVDAYRSTVRASW
jgi:aspartate racemase